MGGYTDPSKKQGRRWERDISIANLDLESCGPNEAHGVRDHSAQGTHECV